MKQKLLKSMLLLCILVGGVCSAWAQETVTWSGSTALPSTATAVEDDQNITIKTSSTNTYTSPIRIYANTTITINATNNAKILSVTYEASSTGNYVTFAEGATVSPNVTPSTSGKKVTWSYDESDNVTEFTFKPSSQTRANSISITYTTSSGGGGSDPSITANDVNIAYDATNGSIAYELANATGNVSASVTTGDWLTLGAVTASEVPFTCSANEGATARTATVTLSFEGATNKVVTVTQAANPNVINNISDITAASTAYTVVGTVVATNSRGFVIGDGTGYVYTYLNAVPTQSVGDKVKIAGTTGTYGHILQFSNTATITSSETSNYDETPAATVVDGTALAAYNSDYQLSDYLQLEGTLSAMVDGNTTYYDIPVGNVTARISYPTDAQTTTLASLISKKVRVKGYFAGTSTKNNVTYYTIMMGSVEEVTTPTITVASSLAVPNYVVGTEEPTYEMLTVNGSNLTADITLSLGVSSNFEMSTDLDNWTNSLTLTQTDGSVTDADVAIRLKADLAKGAYEGTLTLSSTGATNKNVSLSGTVTGQTYAIEQYTTPATAHGTITFSPASPVEDGIEVTLSAEPAEGYNFTADSWVIYKQSDKDYVVDNSITVTENKFTMPAYAIKVDGTFTAKSTYAITCVADPVAGGELISDLDNAYDGQTVTLSYSENTGYKLTGIVITKTSDGSATDITPAVSGDDFTFTMPGYAVTATATYKEIYSSGTFAKYTSAITEGYYVITYNTNALKNTFSSNRFDNDSFTATNEMITDPDPSIVWYIKPNGDYWTLFNDAEWKYAAGTGTKNQGALIESVTDLAKWTVTMSNGTFQFENLGRSNAASDSGNKWLRNNGGNGWACYASSTGGALTLYKMTVLSPRTITFNGNGGTYNEATTYTQDVYDGVEATLDANKFTRSGYEFLAWNNQADGSGATSCDDGAKITVTGSDLTFYAQWAPLYTLTIEDNIDGGSVAVEGNVTSAIEGVNITLTATPTAGHKFSAWNVYKEGDTSTKVEVNDNKFAMPAYNVVVSATFEEVQTYSLVTDVAQLVPGKHYIIANGTNGSVKAIGSQSANNRTAVGVTASSGIIPETEGVSEFVIYGPDANGYYTIYDETNSKYLYAASSDKNYLKAQETNNANGKWTIEITNSGSATVKAQGSYVRNWMRNNGDIFSCYGSGQSDIYLYVKDGDTPVATTTSVKLNAYGYATFASTSALDFLDSDSENASYSAWQITNVNGTTISFSQIENHVKAGTGILLKGTPNATINLNILPVGGATLGDNKLEGITTATAIEADTYYGLSGNKFVKVNAGTVPAGKALLPASVVSGNNVKEFTFIFDGENETSINSLTPALSEGEGVIYNLAGQRLQKMQKGINIVNGKKVLF